MRLIGDELRLLERSDRIAQIGDALLEIGPPSCQIVEADGGRWRGRGVGLHCGGELVEVGLDDRIYVLRLQPSLTETARFDELHQSTRRWVVVASDTRCKGRDGGSITLIHEFE